MRPELSYNNSVDDRAFNFIGGIMVKTRVCDLCKKPELHCEYKLVKKFSLKKLTGGGLTEPPFWTRVDICDVCFNDLLEMVKKRKEKS